MRKCSPVPVRVRVSNLCFFLLAVLFFYCLVAVLAKMFLNGVVVRVRDDFRAKDNTALGACYRCQAQVFHESRESTCLQPTTPQLVQAKCLGDAKRHLVNTRPRTPVAEVAPRGRASHVCVPEATGVGDHDGDSHCAIGCTRRGFRLRTAYDPGARTEP